MERREIPPSSDLGAECTDSTLMIGVGRTVLELVGISDQVEQLVGVGWTVDELEPIATNHHDGRG
jgi:hypothetical protein